MARSKMCESCVHTKVCMNDKNLFGDVFILGHPSFFDNEALYEEFKRREKEGFPCDNYMRIVRCEDCRYGYHWFETRNGVTDSWIECRNPNGLNRDVSEDGYCYCGERKDDETD